MSVRAGRDQNCLLKAGRVWRLRIRDKEHSQFRDVRDRFKTAGDTNDAMTPTRMRHRP